MKHKIMAHDGSVQAISEIPAATRTLYKTAWEIKQKVIMRVCMNIYIYIYIYTHTHTATRLLYKSA